MLRIPPNDIICALTLEHSGNNNRRSGETFMFMYRSVGSWYLERCETVRNNSRASRAGITRLVTLLRDPFITDTTSKEDGYKPIIIIKSID